MKGVLAAHTASATMPASRTSLSTLPGTCVAPPANDLVPDPMTGHLVRRGYRGWDHRNCTHPSPPPSGYQRCEGDNGCAIRIPQGRFCIEHGELVDDLAPADRGKPASSLSPKRAHYPWSRR